MTNNQNDVSSNCIDEQEVVIQEVEVCSRRFATTVTEVAELVLNPIVRTTDTVTRCIGPLEVLEEFPDVTRNCRFVVAQDVRVRFNLEFGANPTVGRTGVICDPETEPDSTE